MNKEYKPIVFAYWVNGELKGFRADTLGTILKYPKIYRYSKDQIEVVLNSTRDMLNGSGTAFFKSLFNKNTSVTSLHTEDELQSDAALNHISETESTVKNWKEFELRVHPFIGSWQNRPENWQMDAEIANLKEPIEVHKFKVVDNEN